MLCERTGVFLRSRCPPENVSIKLKNLRAHVNAGTDALERSDFVEIDDVDLETYLERLTTTTPNQAR